MTTGQLKPAAEYQRVHLNFYEIFKGVLDIIYNPPLRTPMLVYRVHFYRYANKVQAAAARPSLSLSICVTASKLYEIYVNRIIYIFLVFLY